MGTSSGNGAREAATAYSAAARKVAWFDLILTAPFAIPLICEVYLALIYSVHGLLGLPGNVPGFAPFHLVFVNITGVLAVIWAMVRIKYPIREFGLLDAYGRITVATILVFWIWQGATPVLALFVATELGGAVYATWPRHERD